MPSPRLLVRNPSVLQSNNVEHAQLSMVFFLLMLCFQPFRVGLVWHSTAFGSLSGLRNIYRIHFGNPCVKKYVEFNLCHFTEAPGQCGVEFALGPLSRRLSFQVVSMDLVLVIFLGPDQVRTL